MVHLLWYVAFKGMNGLCFWAFFPTFYAVHPSHNINKYNKIVQRFSLTNTAELLINHDSPQKS